MNNRETARSAGPLEASPYAGDPYEENDDRQRQREADEFRRRVLAVTGRERVFPDRGCFWLTHRYATQHTVETTKAPDCRGPCRVLSTVTTAQRYGRELEVRLIRSRKHRRVGQLSSRVNFQ